MEEGFMQKSRQSLSLLLEGTEFIKFLVALAIFYQDDVKDIMKSSFSSLLLECNSSFSSYLPGAARNRINSVPQTAATNFAFSFV